MIGKKISREEIFDWLLSLSEKNPRKVELDVKIKINQLTLGQKEELKKDILKNIDKITLEKSWRLFATLRILGTPVDKINKLKDSVGEKFLSL